MTSRSSGSCGSLPWHWRIIRTSWTRCSPTPSASFIRPGLAIWFATTAASFCTKGHGPSSRGTPIRSFTRSPSRSRGVSGPQLVAAHGYDTKFAYHVVRLIGEVEQILVEQDVDLQRDRELLKAIRRGEWTEERLRQVVRRQGSTARTDLCSRAALRATPDEAGDQGAPARMPRRALREPGGTASSSQTATVVALRNIQAELDRIKDVL